MNISAALSSSTSNSMFIGTGGTSSSSAGPFLNMGEPSSSNTNNIPRIQQQQDEPELCLVCNDVATGYHYGTPSCNGCKTFFRRTVMKKQVFQCQYDGNCPVDKSVRCACRHCRFKKCLAVGMNKDAIQQNRDPIGYTKRTRRSFASYPLVKQQQALLGTSAGGANFSNGGCSTSSTPFPGSVSSTPFPQSGSSNLGQSSLIGAVGPSSSSSAGFSSSSSFSHGPINFGAGISAAAGPSFSASNRTASSLHQQSNSQLQHPSVSAEQLQEDHLLQRLIGIENILVTIRNSKISVQKSLNDLVLNRSVFEDPEMIKKMAAESFQMPNVLRRTEQEDYLYWHERDWFIMIEWAKMLPVYQQLSVSDKLALLRHSAITYPSLIQCFYTPDVGPDTIVFPNGAFFDRTLDPNKPTGFQRKNFKMLDNLLNPIRKMKIDQSEFAGAKGIFFLNPGNFEDGKSLGLAIQRWFPPDSDADDLSPEAKAQIAVARSAITNALYRYMVQKRGTEEAADKFGKLLLLGTAIATMSCEMKEAVVVADFFDQIRFSGFARQLLLAKDEDDLLIGAAAQQQQQQQQQQSLAQQQQQQQASSVLQQPPPLVSLQQQQQYQQPQIFQMGTNLQKQQFAFPHDQFFALPPINSSASSCLTTNNNSAVTMAMINGLNAQMQQQQHPHPHPHHQQQQQNNLFMAATAFQNHHHNDLPLTNGQVFLPNGISQHQSMEMMEERKKMEEKEKHEQQQEKQKQLQQQLMAAAVQQQTQLMSGQTQLGPQTTILPHQTMLPSQDQQPPFTPAMFPTTLPTLTSQPLSAQSQQSFATTSPPSLINLT